jgi:hypothetical protein
MSMTHKHLEQLERLALSAHRRGQSWSEFWRDHAAAVRQAEPWDNRARHRLIRRLSYLVTCGDTAGMMPLTNGWSEPAPWELDDSGPPVSAYAATDYSSAARLLWSPAPER